ncbi:MAG TPA: glycosyltransferase [Vitreimonas sp.]|nr:glycosyltransferase [Vitreimonas sp.]
MMTPLIFNKVIIVSHVLGTVPFADLEKFLLEKKLEQLLVISHPLLAEAQPQGSLLKQYHHQHLTRQSNFKLPFFTPPVSFIFDFFLTLWWIISTQQKWQVMVGLNNLSVLAGLCLRKLGLVEKVVYYTIDFTPERFSQHWLNEGYHWLDKWCVKHADMTWNVSPRIAEGREKIRGLAQAEYPRQVVVSIGVWLDRIQDYLTQPRKKHHIVYAGGLAPHQGVETLLRSLPRVLKTIPDVTLTVIGSGQQQQFLNELAIELGINEHVEFTGYLAHHHQVEEKLCTGELAIAMYNKTFDRWSKYADPSKMKSYLACGLPIITTNVTYMGAVLEKNECGVVIKDDSEVLAQTIIKVLRNREQLKTWRKNALQLAVAYDWRNIYQTAFNTLI